jgi:hypothetical protein
MEQVDPGSAAVPRLRRRSSADRLGARGWPPRSRAKGDWPLCILTACTFDVPDTLADGTPGFAAAYQLIGRMARRCYDDLGRR